MTTVPFKCKIGTSNPAALLGLEVLLDKKSVYRSDHVTDLVDLTVDIVEDDAEHQLTFCLFGKTPEHTEVDDQGNIVKDSVLTITDITLDDIDINHLFTEHAVYTHDFNGSQEEIKDKFYGAAGCNGSITITVSTPVYIWLLENL